MGPKNIRVTNITNPQKIWEHRYQTSPRNRPNTWPADPWLEPWRSVLDRPEAAPVLEIGCGLGRDSAYLTGLGLPLIAADYAATALAPARRTAPQATFLQLDLRDGLPFRPNSFHTVVASLCLHYFSWPQTQQIVSELQTCLKPGGHLLARVNSTKDVHHGAVGYEAVEPNFFSVKGELKRFFDHDSLLKLFQAGWDIIALAEREIIRRRPKVIWEVVVQQPG